MHPNPQLQRSRLAVLIDTENADARRIESILTDVAARGTASVKRAYGDWTTSRLTSWKDKLHKFAIQPIQQFRYTSGKNVSDGALIIDAMDLLHSGKFDAFCLVSSDSDFIRLACRLRESGIMVYGFGEQKTPEPFRQACNQFVVVESPVPTEEGGRISPGDPSESAVVACPGGVVEARATPESTAPDAAPTPAPGMEGFESLRRLCGKLSKACLDIRDKIRRGARPTSTQVKKWLDLCAEAPAVCGNPE
jgi:hypothetical protein